MTDATTVINWLLDPEPSDPAIRWQVMRELLDSPETKWKAERAKVETEGWGERLLGFEDEDGQWAGGAHFPSDFAWDGDEPGQPWTSTSHSLSQLREFGFDPSTDRARRMAEPSINGQRCLLRRRHVSGGRQAGRGASRRRRMEL